MLRTHTSWRTRAGYLGAAATAASLTLFGVTWLVTPAQNSGIFGVVLSGAALAYGRVKGAEDLLLAALLGTFLVRRDRSALVTTLLVGLILPLGDLLAITAAGLSQASQLVIHLVFLIVMPLSALSLRKERMVFP